MQLLRGRAHPYDDPDWSDVHDVTTADGGGRAGRRRGRRSRQDHAPLRGDLGRREGHRRGRDPDRRRRPVLEPRLKQPPASEKASRKRSRNSSIRQTGASGGRQQAVLPPQPGIRRAPPGPARSRDRYVVAGALAAHVAVRLVVAQHQQHPIRVGRRCGGTRSAPARSTPRTRRRQLQHLRVAEDLDGRTRPLGLPVEDRAVADPVPRHQRGGGVHGSWLEIRSISAITGAGRGASSRGGSSRACTGPASRRSRTPGPR